MICLVMCTAYALLGCSDRDDEPRISGAGSYRPLVIVVAPVLNLSNHAQLDMLKITDVVASEFLSFGEVSVVPVNLTLAALARRGQVRVETPQEAVDLAREFGAAATIVTAITEYDPYDPPRLGIVMQWYPAEDSLGYSGGLDPVSASRQAGEVGYEPGAGAPPTPYVQVQRVYNAADEDLLDEIRDYGGEREGHSSPYGWRRYVASQELFVRYCCWSTIRTILTRSPPVASSAERAGTGQ